MTRLTLPYFGHIMQRPMQLSEEGGRKEKQTMTSSRIDSVIAEKNAPLEDPKVRSRQSGRKCVSVLESTLTCQHIISQSFWSFFSATLQFYSSLPGAKMELQMQCIVHFYNDITDWQFYFQPPPELLLPWNWYLCPVLFLFNSCCTLG